MKLRVTFLMLMVLLAFVANANVRPGLKATFQDVSTTEANDLIQSNTQNDNFVILDVRTKAEYDEAHIKNSFVMDFYATTFDSELNKLDKTKIYMVYCRTGNRSKQALTKMETAGFSTAYNMLGGITQWNTDNRTVASPTSLVGEDISTAVSNAMIAQHNLDTNFVLLDVREPAEFEEEKIEGSVMLDFNSSTFDADLALLDKNKQYLVYCRTGNRSRQAVDKMLAQNFIESYNMLGGITQWKADGYPTETPTPIIYCEAKGNSVQYEWIAGVVIGDFTNISGADGGYKDNTDKTISVDNSGSVSLTLTPEFAGTGYSEYWKIFVDFNKDGDFEDAGEEVFSGNGTAILTGTMSFPASATGTSRLRVVMRYNTAPSACGSFDYGEVEDYTISFGGGDVSGPSTPQNLAASNITTSSVDLSWDASTDNIGVTAYRVFNGSTQIKTVTSTSTTVAELTPNTTYSFTVKSMDAAGNVSNMSTPVSVTTIGVVDTIPPSFPLNINVSNVTPTTLVLSWDAATDNVGVTGYIIIKDNVTLQEVPHTTLSINITGLIPQTTYVFKVKAKDAAGNISEDPVVITVTTPAIPIENYCESKGTSQQYEWITGVQVGNYSKTTVAETDGYGDYTSETITLIPSTSVEVILTPNTTQYTEHFKVWIDYNKDSDFEDEGEEVLSGSAKGNTTGTFIVPSDANGTTRMRVSMKYNAAPTGPCETIAYGEVEDYTISFFIEGGEPPTVPTNLTASNITQTSVDLTWTASTDNVGVIGYDVYQGGVLAKSVTNTSASITDLTTNTTYSFTVKAKDAAGNESAASSALSVITLSESGDSIPPSAPQNLTISDVTTVSMNLSWDASTDNVGVTGYDVYQDGIKVGSVTTTSYSATNLSAEVSYTFFVRAKDIAGNESAASAGVTQKTLAASYCMNIGASQQYEWIAGVQIGGWKKLTGASAYTNYSDSLTIIVDPGKYTPITLTPGFAGSAYTEYWTIWIDINNDGDFEDANEKIFTKSSNAVIEDSTMFVPAGVQGIFRVRVSMSYSDNAPSCGTFEYGEVEDYKVWCGCDPGAPVAKKSTDFEFKFYPNPAETFVNLSISFDSDKVVSVQIASIGGKVVFNDKRKIPEGITTEQIVFGNIPKGLYILSITDGVSTQSEKLIIK